MKSLLILRHAKSSWKDPELTDHDRPLNKRGKCDAPRIGKLLKNEHLVPEAMISSTAKRARATAEREVFVGQDNLSPEELFSTNP
jgi:phosphohistidine phosphatase